MTPQSEKFFTVLGVIIFIVVAMGWYQMFVNQNFAVFTTEEEIPDYSQLLGV